LLNSTGDTDNNYLFTGEQYDKDLDNYYLRARYYNPEIGRFTRQDEWMGRDNQPVTLNKYLYANVDGANWIDPSGYMTIGSVMSGVAVQNALRSGATNMAFRVTLQRTANRAMCVLVEEVVKGAVTHGIYVLQDGASHYVGQSNDIDHRIEQHKNNTNKKIRDTLAKFHFPFTKNSKRILEQFMMDFTAKVFAEELTNGRREIAKEPKSSNSQRLRKILGKLDFCK
jgi:RHS repeat-associated protein